MQAFHFDHSFGESFVSDFEEIVITLRFFQLSVQFSNGLQVFVLLDLVQLTVVLVLRVVRCDVEIVDQLLSITQTIQTVVIQIIINGNDFDFVDVVVVRVGGVVFFVFVVAVLDVSPELHQFLSTADQFPRQVRRLSAYAL